MKKLLISIDDQAKLAVSGSDFDLLATSQRKK